MIDGIIDRFVYPGCGDTGGIATYNMNGTQCLVRRRCGSNRWIIYAHGNMVSIKTVEESGIPRAMSDACDCNFVCPEYAGYGDQPTSELSGEALDHDMARRIHTVITYLRQHGVVDIVLVGRSIGTAVVMHLYDQYPEDAMRSSALILVSGFTSLRAMTPAPLRCLVSRRLDSERAMGSIPSSVPKLVIHGSRDEVIPMIHGEMLAAVGEATFRVVDKMGHVPDVHAVCRICSRFLKDCTMSTGPVEVPLNEYVVTR